jgi:hypothetical protein
MHPDEEPCALVHVATLPSGLSVADRVRAEVAVWHETEAAVIAHATRLLATLNLRLAEGAAATTAGVKAVASIVATKMSLSRMMTPERRNSTRTPGR